MVRQLIVVLALCCISRAQDLPAPDQFQIARRTFFDFGPPFNFYDLFLVRGTGKGTSVQRISLTPAPDACVQPPTIEVTTGHLDKSVRELLGRTNPCSIPEKELRRELKRCKKCLVFSGANIAMQVQCGNQSRIIRADVLDRDMFDPSANTPERTSWTMQLLGRIGQAVGSGVMDRQTLEIPSSEEHTPSPSSDGLQDIGAGKYDELFKGAPDKPSDLYHATQVQPPVPTIHLVSSEPFQPETFVQPEYPSLAKLARVEGTVSFTILVNPDGSASNFILARGNPMLKGTTERAVLKWKFPESAAGLMIHGSLQFATNCPAKRED